VGIKERAARATASAVTIAAATSGLTSCDGIGAVDPAPPPLQCDAVGQGQTLQVEGTLIGADTVAVQVRHNEFYEWAVDSVVAVTGGSIHNLVLPQENPGDPWLLSFRLVLNPETTGAVFRVYANTSDFGGKTCQIVRQFSVSTDEGSATVTLAQDPELPLPARHGATIKVLASEGRVTTLEAQTAYPGKKEIGWSVSAGVITELSGDRVAWTLPQAGGIYQAEVVIDFGLDGVAFDALSLEVL